MLRGDSRGFFQAAPAGLANASDNGIFEINLGSERGYRALVERGVEPLRPALVNVAGCEGSNLLSEVATFIPGEGLEGALVVEAHSDHLFRPISQPIPSGEGGGGEIPQTDGAIFSRGHDFLAVVNEIREATTIVMPEWFAQWKAGRDIPNARGAIV